MPWLRKKKRPGRLLETNLKRLPSKKTKHLISKFRRTKICLQVNLLLKNLIRKTLK